MNTLTKPRITKRQARPITLDHPHAMQCHALMSGLLNGELSLADPAVRGLIETLRVTLEAQL